ncbi:CAP domain-containing protein [bacterium]|nr:CAP domain-containing protein [bacterium]
MLALVLVVGSVRAQTVGEVEDLVYRATCHQRQKYSLRQLEQDALLSEIARGHSEEMLTLSYFSHKSPNQLCETVRDRLRFGHRFSLTWAENLHKCDGYDANVIARQAVDCWMASPEHRHNLLNRSFNRVGVGVAHRNQTYLFTQLLSYETIAIDSLIVVPAPSGYQIEVRARVVEGPDQGSFFVNGLRRLDWKADASGCFCAQIQMQQPGLLEIGQAAGTRLWQVETSIPIPPPEMHLKHVSLPEMLAMPSWLQSLDLTALL